ncbi:H/ACA ribonucleoprotein complex non-core subunit NAF1-like [Zingiber officinale]|uniref:H/ACA ribonucleoprotein complex non-core subunit NAF1 n=1 Tax=Zingiber officinale TaxID=94328 RepID=A0A8J5LFD0_ZINOF|nr:H/ACA ribonucleoprotein complex non-core subunit NAF1-like [Zingiber officinale]KAG6512562.1 hypothetical protein ZIOFF_030687 [Zingiber officinale]
MDEEKINPSSPDGGLAHGSPPRSPAFDLPVEAPRESSTVDEGVFVPSSNGGGESVSSALNADAFMSNSSELDIPIYEKMEGVSLSGNCEDLLPDPPVPVAAGEVTRQHPLSEDDDMDSGSEGGETRSDDSESDESSSEDSDSSTSTGSSEDEKEADAGSHGVGGVGIEEGPIGSDNEEEVLSCPVKSKNELEVLPPVPPVEVSLEPHHQTIPVGLISSVFGNRVIVEGSVDHNPLNEGSILWITETRIPLGIIDEIFGPVKNPYYVVRYNSEKDVPVGIIEGTAVSFVMEFAAYVLDKDISKRGYDASGENDEEVFNEMEFSDDEKETEYKRSLRQTKRGTDDFKFGNREKGAQKKKTRDKGRGANKSNIPTFSHGPETVEQSGPGTRGHNKPSRLCNSGSVKSLSSRHLASGSGVAQAASLAVNALSNPATPSYQLSQHQHASPGHAMPFLQQTNPSMAFRMPIPLQQQQQTFWPPSVPMQELQNVMLAHGMQQQIAAMTGLQMNLFLNQQLENQARLHQHQNNILMPSHPQLFQMLSTPNLPQIGINSSCALVPPTLVGQVGIGQAPLMPVPAVQGVSPMLGNHQSHGQPFLAASRQSAITDPMQFNPGSSSGSGRMPRRKGGGNSFKRGT